MRNTDLISTVKAEKCGRCGHHEIGTVDKNGKFTQLKPGTQIIIVERGDDDELGTE